MYMSIPKCRLLGRNISYSRQIIPGDRKGGLLISALEISKNVLFIQPIRLNQRY